MYSYGGLVPASLVRCILYRKQKKHTSLPLRRHHILDIAMGCWSPRIVVPQVTSLAGLSASQHDPTGMLGAESILIQPHITLYKTGWYLLHHCWLLYVIIIIIPIVAFMNGPSLHFSISCATSSPCRRSRRVTSQRLRCLWAFLRQLSDRWVSMGRPWISMAMLRSVRNDECSRPGSLPTLR